MNAADEQARNLVQAIRQWAASLPDGSFALTETLDPRDEYRSYAVLSFKPTNPRACPMEVTIVAYDASWLTGWAAFLPRRKNLTGIAGGPPSTGILLNSWERLLASGILRAAPLRGSGKDRAVLFMEPTVLPFERVLEICEAVARGRVIAQAGIAFGRLGATTGAIQLESEFLPMNGVNIWPWSIIKLLRHLGLGDLRTVRYEPWI